MKTKLLLSALLSFSFYLLSSQVPQGFNYQAIARDGSGSPIVGATIKVRLSILSDTNGFRPGGGGVYVWEEEHLDVSTNAYGLFNIVLGDPSASIIVGTSFNAIDWNKPKLFIGTKIANPSTYKVLGAAKLWSVPYSLVAGELGGTVEKIKVKGTEIEPDSALFEVKNKNGQIVFAVYNEGVRVYVADGVKGNTKGGFAIGGFGTDKGGTSQNYLMVSSDSIRAYVNDTIVKGVTKGGFAIGGFGTAKRKPQDYLRVTRDSTRVYVYDDGTKGNTKGGFAIGGFDNTKGLTQKLMTVSKDSIRIYIDDNAGKGNTKGGFAIGGFDNAKGGNVNFLNVATDPTGKINPSQNRVLWYPLDEKNAFLVGKVLILNKDSVGVNSVTLGYESMAKGAQSQAFGYMSKARGDYSTAIGYQAVAHKASSFALGETAKAMALNSYSFGRNTEANGQYSFAFGESVKAGTAANSNSYAFGRKSQATGKSAYAIGDSVIASNSNTYAFGRKAIATGSGSFAFGYNAMAIGQDAFAFGTGTEANGLGSFALGFIGRDSAGVATGNTKATVDYGVAIGMGAQATKKGAFSIGLQTIANGEYSLAMGYKSSATNYYASSIGSGTTASGIFSFAAGWLSNAAGQGSIAMGTGATTVSDYSISIGFGSATNGTGTIAIGRGAKATNTNALAMGGATASGIGSIAMGTQVKASGTSSVAFGNLTKGFGSYSTAIGYRTNAKPYASFAVGYLNDTTVSVTGATTWINTDPLFMVGNGGMGTPSNAFTVYKNGNAYIMGNLGIGVASAAEKLHVVGNGYLTGSLTIDGSIGMGGDISLSGKVTSGSLTVSGGDVWIRKGGDYDVWIQGGTTTAMGTARNLALLGNKTLDRLYLNYDGEYTSGTQVDGFLNAPDTYNRSVNAGNHYLFISSAGDIGGINGSSIRYKDNVFDLENFNWLYDLRPVIYNYKKDDPSVIQYGMIAEEVDKVNPLLVVYDKENRPEGLMYERLTVPMLKALQEQQKVISRQESEIQSLRTEIEQIKAMLLKGGVK